MKAYRKYKTAQGIGAIRTRMGLTQQAFAIELGISKSLVSMVENHQRNLPTSALVKLAAMEKAIAVKSTPADQRKPHPVELEEDGMNEHAPSAMYFKEMNCRLEAQKQQYRLNQMEINYSQLRQSLENLEKLIGSEACLNGNFRQGFLELHRYHITRKLIRCSLPAQAALRHKITLLQAAAELNKTVHLKY
jgi:transcriptional regulator with XRE-family HTH domain